MRAPKVEIAGGHGFDLLVSAVAVADPDWRDVLAHGAAVWSTVRHGAGAETARQAARFGRFGWINLIGLLAGHSGRGGRNDLVALVDGTPADELRFVVAGGRREQLRERLGAERLREALAGDATAARELSRALATPGIRAADESRTDPATRSRHHRTDDAESTVSGNKRKYLVKNGRFRQTVGKTSLVAGPPHQRRM